MDILIVSVAAGLAALLTLFSGFGLGTLLMPVFALFVPLPLAVAATAVVHLANNLFKSALLLRHADWAIVLRFGVPAWIAALFGALLLGSLSGEPEVLARYTLWGTEHEITALRFVLGGLILGFAVFEMLPLAARATVPLRWMPLGGIVSGFLGGLSGHQGALRAVFLRRLSLDPTRFAATQALIAILVDVSRLAVYGAGFVGLLTTQSTVTPLMLACACSAAFVGSALARRLLPRVTVEQLRWLTAGLLATVGTLLLSGII